MASSATSNGHVGSNGAASAAGKPPVLTFAGARVKLLDDEGAAPTDKFNSAVTVFVEYDPEGVLVSFKDAGGRSLQEFLVKQNVESSRVGTRGIIFKLEIETVLVRFEDEAVAKKFASIVNDIRTGSKTSVFKDRTEDSSAMQYFQFYGYLSQQQNMMQDYIRTSTYQKAILSNLADFKDKVVMDVGAGSGILSFFAQQAGAKKVYAVEGSSIAKHANKLVHSNNVNDVIQIVSGKIEEIEIPEKVDVIISEPMGYMLLNERMLETYLHAKKWLKPGGKMFPTRGDLHVAPFTDEALYMEQINKVNFWYQDYFHGVNLSSLRDAAFAEYFRQPVVDTFDVRICLAKTQKHTIDFLTATEEDLHKVEIPLEYHITQSGTVHGLAFWFDVAFDGSGACIWLSTAPTEPLTHWYQVRCLLTEPLMVKQGQVLTGKVIMAANAKQSYDVTIECGIMGTSFKSTNTLDLKNPYFRYTGVQPQPPPGTNTTSPSETYWTQMDMQGARQAVNLVNGMIVDGLGHVSLDNNAQQVATNYAAANIHQGSIPATGRKDSKAGLASSSSSIPQSAPNSIPFNQLIGGGVSPSVLSQSGAASATSMMIGDYVNTALPTQIASMGGISSTSAQQQQPFVFRQ